MSLIEVQNLTFAYDGSPDYVFEHVSLQLDTNWRLGLVGRNGRGKTTFLNLLMGKYPYSGRITVPVEFEYFPYPVPDGRIHTLDAVNGICGDAPSWQLSRELNLLEVSEDVLYRPFRTLSNGEQIKVLLAALFLKESRFLLIDEPTNHLDAAGRAMVSRYLSRKSGFILVSHDRAFLDGCVDHILSIHRTGLELQQGNFSSWQQNQARRDLFEQAENRKLKQEIGRLRESARETAVWSDRVEQSKFASRNAGLRPDRGYLGHKSAKLMKRSKSMEKRRAEAVEEKEALLKNLETCEDLKLSQPDYYSGRLASLSGVSISYGGKSVCRDVTFSIEQGDRIALSGKNGSGKSSLMKLVSGEAIPHTGTFERGSRLKISYVSQDTSFLRGSLSQYAAEHGLDESLLKTILRKLDVPRLQFEKDLWDFSGGQKKKVLIAGSLCETSHLLLWDEPLNDIDVLSRMQIERLLLASRPTILFVEHDRAFCDAVATRVVRL